MSHPGPYILGIAGATCSGKSELARRLMEEFPEKRPIVISVDCYYRDLSALEPAERDSRNFDTPEAIEAELLHRHLEQLAGGEEILRPVYDYASHTRADHSVHVIPGDLVIVEGLFVLYWVEVRRWLNSKVFISLDTNACLSRRIDRDVRERGRNEQSVLEQFEKSVRPMTERYVTPTRAFADILVNGEDPVERSAAEVISRIGFLRGA